MARFDWFAWHRNYRTDEWIHSLSEAERWAWVAFLSYANEYDFEVEICKTEILAPLLCVTNVSLRDMLKSAIEHGKVTEDGRAWRVKSGNKYRVRGDETAKERQAKFRESQKVKEVINNPNSNGNNVSNVSLRTPVYTETRQDKTETKTRQQPPPPKSPPSVKTGGEAGGGGAVVLEPEQTWTEGVEEEGKIYDLNDPEGVRQYHADFVARERAKMRAEREKENARIDAEMTAGVESWTKEFCNLIKNCDQITKGEIREAIARLESHDLLQNTLINAKDFIESGQAKSPKAIILHRINQLG